MSIQQLDLFSFNQEERPAAPQASPILRGFYYEASTDKFVSFSLGRRHYEVSAKRCTFSKAWQTKIKKERSI